MSKKIIARECPPTKLSEAMRGTIEEIDLNSGPATLLQETGFYGALNRITEVWSVPDRVYLLSGKLNRELAIATANAVQ